MSTKTTGTALITGASAGIGAEYAERLAKRGYDLILTARDTHKLETLDARIRGTGHRVEVIGADLSVADDVSIIERKLTSDPNITLFVNNAGQLVSQPLLESDPDRIDTMILVNVTAFTRL